MGFKQRERKRRAKAAQRSAQQRARDSGSSSCRYYLTKVRHPCRCSACGAKLRAGDDMVYRRDGPVTLCLPCADGDPLVDYRTALRWERSRARSRSESRTARW
jgi:hypothetical protein